MKAILGTVVAVSMLLCMACSGTSVDEFDLAALFFDWTDSHLAIKNNTGVNIVIFRNSLTEGNKLGGVENGKELRVKQLDGLQVLLAINAQDYISGNFAKARILDSTLAYVYQNEYITNTFVDRTAGGKGVLRFNNNTSKHLEIYSGYWGQTLVATVPPNSSQEQYLPDNQDIALYPTLVSSVESSGQIVSLKREQITNIYLASPDPVATEYNFSSPVVKNTFMYLYVKNNSDNGIFLMNGTTMMYNTLGRMTINLGGKVSIYEFSPVSGVGSVTYRDISTLKIGGPTMTPVSVGTIRIDYGGNHYITFNADRTVTTNQAPF